MPEKARKDKTYSGIKTRCLFCSDVVHQAEAGVVAAGAAVMDGWGIGVIVLVLFR